MSIYNVDAHIRCFCYRDGQEALIELREFQTSVSADIRLNRYVILYVVEGVITISYNKTTRTLQQGRLVFLPIAASVHYRAVEKTTLLVFRMYNDLYECPHFNTTALWNEPEEKRRQDYEEMYVLESNDKLDHFLAGILSLLRDGDRCLLYMRLKISLLLYLLQLYYSREECKKFFSVHPNLDVTFAEFVRTNYLKYPTVAAFAEAMHMTHQQFAYQFEKVFGRSPHQWIEREKAQAIYQDICRSNQTLKEIALRYGFDIHSNFIRFCRKNFAMSPGALRNRQKSEGTVS